MVEKRVKKFLILSFLGLLLINLALVSAYILFTKYGSLTLNPGEKYVVNIPFIGPSNSPTICGTAQQNDGTLLKNITVVLKSYNSNTTIAQNTTNSDGKYCITLTGMNSSQKFDVYIQYDNQTIILGSNDYTLSFGNNLIYSKSINDFVYLTGNITNRDARIENGRFEINLKYNETGKFTNSEEIFDYQKYFLNIEPNEIYSVPNDELNVSWEIPNDAKIGMYKFYIKTSFNGKERTSNIYFNITE
jgi:hypothetical protein